MIMVVVVVVVVVSLVPLLYLNSIAWYKPSD
jgi:hypothetical protein